MKCGMMMIKFLQATLFISAIFFSGILFIAGVLSMTTYWEKKMQGCILDKEIKNDNTDEL
jgi:hypothetical protein